MSHYATVNANTTVHAVSGFNEKGHPLQACGFASCATHMAWLDPNAEGVTCEKCLNLRDPDETPKENPMTDHPLTKTPTTAEPLARTLLGVPEGHGSPHHDEAAIKAGDYVAQVDADGYIRAGRAHGQDGDGDWLTEDGYLITWATKRADRPDALTIWPAPTPPAEEVELPSEFGDIIYDVEADFGETVRFDRMVWTGFRWTYWDHSTVAKFIIAFTLPNGTRARRDGEHADGTPRFVKVQEGEK